MKQKKKVNKKAVGAAIAIAIAVIFAAIILITNIFIPFKYLSTYMAAKDIPKAGELRVRYLNVGYGDCTVVEFPDGKTMVIDGGDGRYSHELKIFKALNSANIDNIDYLVCTTVRNEHCGGLYEILKHKTVNTLYAPDLTDRTKNENFARVMELADKKVQNIKICQYGESVVGEEGYAFAFLSPLPYAWPQSEYRALNSEFTESTVSSASAILYLEYMGQKFIFLGDASAEVQTRLFETLIAEPNYLIINNKPVNMCEIAVVKVSNHGSAYGFSELFYDLILPDTAIISVGDNAKGAPSDSTLQSIKNFRDIFRTDTDGTITVTVDKSGKITLSKEKK